MDGVIAGQIIAAGKIMGILGIAAEPVDIYFYSRFYLLYRFRRTAGGAENRSVANDHNLPGYF